MATPSQKLADALKALQQLRAAGAVAIRSAELSRVHRERLVQRGFLEEVIKGWYIPAWPDETSGESTSWYSSFWQFCSAYLNYLKGDAWCLSPEQSIALHTENMTVPKQLLVRATKARNNVTVLPHNTSILDIRANLPEPHQRAIKNGMRIFSLPAALVACRELSYIHSPTDMRAALAMVSDASEILAQLLSAGHSIIAGRLAGGFRNIGRERIADEIVAAMKAAGYDIRESDPFDQPTRFGFSSRERSPYVNRIGLMWQDMRQTVIDHFPEPPERRVDVAGYMKSIEDIYTTDAYHSLSIEGYRVTPELIKRVQKGSWAPRQNADDKETKNALAARGYWQATIAVRNSIERILAGENTGKIVEADHRGWYRELFSPGVAAGIHRPADLAGYRNTAVFIRKSKHVPPSKEAVRDAMPAFFQLLTEEQHPAVRAVLGHFIFVFIHPYVDGNGRMGRFLMNAMLASGGYPWAVIPLDKRQEYMAALEAASSEGDIKPFAQFLGALVRGAPTFVAPHPAQ